MYQRMVPSLVALVVVCCLVMALVSAFSGPRTGFGGYAAPIFIGPSWSHGGPYHGGPYGPPSGGYNPPSPPSSGGSGRSPSGGYGGGGSTGGHGGK